ncbi:alpha/beta hydrolase family protein [Sutcliffiella halmapala]|uniref:alpha/beta hydrolase family protein n=1 Tax=Sutcliffiella halmapala TaxID=79882 RepID=UPI000994CA00|nr:alpha/beta fold hydrolase [Sutcliffiella halmapala]
MKSTLAIDWQGINLSVSIEYPTSYFDNDMKNALFPVIIICHGFIGSKVGVNRLFVKASKELTLKNYIIVRFDYLGCGESEGEYGNNTMHDMIHQTKQVISLVKKLERTDSTNLTLIGHSLGGAVALLTAIKEQSVKKLILWSAVGNPFLDIMNIIKKRVTDLDYHDTFDYQGFLLKKDFLLSLKEYEPLKWSFNYTGDVLVIHGDEDEEISVHYSTQYELAFHSRQTGAMKKHIISGADHTYSSHSTYNQLIQTTIDWMESYKQTS